MLYISISYTNSRDCTVNLYSAPGSIGIKKQITIKENSRWADLKIFLTILSCSLIAMKRLIVGFSKTG